MHKNILSYKGREVPAIKLRYSFASDRNMLIGFLGWMILNLVGRIKISIHFTNFKNISIHRLLYGANKVFQWGLSYWVDYIQNVALQYFSVVEWSFHQSSQQTTVCLGDWVPWTTGADVGWMGRWACIMPWNDEANAESYKHHLAQQAEVGLVWSVTESFEVYDKKFTFSCSSVKDWWAFPVMFPPWIHQVN